MLTNYFKLVMSDIFPDIMHIKVNNDQMTAIFNLIELNFFRAYPSLKLQILFYSNGQAIWHGFFDITHTNIRIIMAASQPF